MPASVSRFSASAKRAMALTLPHRLCIALRDLGRVPFCCVLAAHELDLRCSFLPLRHLPRLLDRFLLAHGVGEHINGRPLDSGEYRGLAF